MPTQTNIAIMSDPSFISPEKGANRNPTPSTATNDGAPPRGVQTPRAAPPKAPGVGLAAAVKKLNNVMDKDTMLKELSFQHNIYVETDANKKAALVDTFNKKLLASNKLKVFVVNVGGILRLVHSLKLYEGEMDEECEYDETVIGWVGDRTETKDPKVVQIDESAMLWSEMEVMTSEEPYKKFYEDSAQRKRFYKKEDNDSTKTLMLPKMLLVPSALVPWLLEAPRTPWEYHQELLDNLGGPQVDKRPKVLDLSLVCL